MKMKAITVWQPWATLLATGKKKSEEPKQGEWMQLDEDAELPFE